MALQTSAGWAAMKQVFEWMSKPVQHSILRVNTLRMTPQEALKQTQESLDKEASQRGRPSPRAWIHPVFEEAIVMSAWPNLKPITEPFPNKEDMPVVIIDTRCANAALRGAPIYKGGILAISGNISVKDKVRIEVHREGIRGWIGYGIVHSVPEALGRECASDENNPHDCAIEMTEGLSIVPPLPKELLAGGFAVSQSLPSIVTSHVLDPQPGERILDCGCGTGLMTTHIAALTWNAAEIIAVDHSTSRLDTLVNRCKLLGAKVTPVKADVRTFAKKETVGFDRILVHPYHSNYGVRPSIVELVGRGRRINLDIREHVKNAVNLLKPGGRLVYCSGSVVPLENDAVIRWLLDRRSDLKLEPAEPRIAAVGVKSPLPIPSWMRLLPDEEKLLQRFGPGTAELETDPVHADVPGFFIACLTKVQ